MGKNLAVEGCVIMPSAGTAKVEITTPASTTVKAGGKGCYFGTISIAVSNYTGAVTQGTGAGTITGTATAVKDNQQPAVLEGDQSVAITITGLLPSGQSGTTTDIFKITNAGQNYVTGV